MILELGLFQLLRNHLLVKDNKTSYILNDGRCNENIDSTANTNNNENSSCDNGDYGYTDILYMTKKEWY